MEGSGEEEDKLKLVREEGLLLRPCVQVSSMSVTVLLYGKE